MFAVPPPPLSPSPPRVRRSAAAAGRKPSDAKDAADAPSRFSELDPTNPEAQESESLVQYLARNPTALLTDHERCFDLVAAAAVAGEVVLSAAVQAQAFLDGERNYAMLKGESGPANYPALHIYLYSALSSLTERGTHLARAQWAFAGIYVATMAAVLFGVYRRNPRIPPYAVPLLCISRRLHSIYMLRMFNDCVVMLLFYCALALYMVPAGTSTEGVEARRAKAKVERSWLLGTVLISCALSIKMSTLLFLPALFYLVFVHLSPLALLQHLVVLVSTQILLSAPFLRTAAHRVQYLSQAFDFHRAFEWEFTVNWRWIGQEAFEDPQWGRGLLVAHAAGLVMWALKWAAEDGGVVRLLRRARANPAARPAAGKELTPSRIATTFFCTNLTGIVCARSLHPQFYAWFAHQLVWLCWGTECAFEPMHCLVLISLVEYGFTAWPSTVNSSLGLVLSLVILLFGVYYGGGDARRQSAEGAQQARDVRKEEDVVVPAVWAARPSDDLKRD
ncbi:dolichyl-P-Man:Man(5)GlcNAc(2)-PP-dolichol alpha-1,3-mannosyltransferase [Rhodotorula sphaerocarpa]